MSTVHILEVSVSQLDDAVINSAARGPGSGEQWDAARSAAGDVRMAYLVDWPKCILPLPIDGWRPPVLGPRL